jgi:hypothetical protein
MCDRLLWLVGLGGLVGRPNIADSAVRPIPVADQVGLGEELAPAGVAGGQG